MEVRTTAALPLLRLPQAHAALLEKQKIFLHACVAGRSGTFLTDKKKVGRKERPVVSYPIIVIVMSCHVRRELGGARRGNCNMQMQNAECALCSCCCLRRLVSEYFFSLSSVRILATSTSPLPH
ncbi:hypothetical protein CC80DRAFT_491558 [Byssothecium circinans]|uniref:Uncharacterized protein n=1 Tax=Byssothecium circinans TaxID=147558 RepID=A0A6A5U0S6_9PLEO|nr:hypothetical protein CC80DRAFT_491558 [Byssothecium circinans]